LFSTSRQKGRTVELVGTRTGATGPKHESSSLIPQRRLREIHDHSDRRSKKRQHKDDRKDDDGCSAT
jgi:hypothetical protein